MRRPKNRKAQCHPDKPHKAFGLCLPCYRRGVRAHDPVGYRDQQVKYDRVRKYGLDDPAYQRMLDAQQGKCAICGATEPGGVGRHWAVDHDHATGAVRGLLCAICNLGLGAFRDSPAYLREAAAYLGRTEADPPQVEPRVVRVYTRLSRSG